MYIAATEILLFPGKAASARQYHDSLEPHLHQISGFIKERQCKSVDVSNKVVLLSWWEDAAALSRWRNQSNHLRIQEKASKEIFEDYTTRIGPAYEANKNIVESFPQRRSFMVLYWRQKRNGQAFELESPFELKDEAVSRVQAAMLYNAMYEDEASVLRLSVWGSQDDALLYEESVARVEGDTFERVCVERDYTKERRDDAPHQMPGH